MMLTSHILAELQERVDRLAILSAGRVQAVGSVQGLREQMALPLRAEVVAAEAGTAAVREALRTLPVSDPRWQGAVFDGQFPREAKLAVLAALAGLGSAIRDFRIQEPSVEDVFFGFSD